MDSEILDDVIDVGGQRVMICTFVWVVSGVVLASISIDRGLWWHWPVDLSFAFVSLWWSASDGADSVNMSVTVQTIPQKCSTQSSMAEWIEMFLSVQILFVGRRISECIIHYYSLLMYARLLYSSANHIQICLHSGMQWSFFMSQTTSDG